MSTGTLVATPKGAVTLSVPAVPSTAVTVAGTPSKLTLMSASVEKACPVNVIVAPASAVGGVGPELTNMFAYCIASLIASAPLLHLIERSDVCPKTAGGGGAKVIVPVAPGTIEVGVTIWPSTLSSRLPVGTLSAVMVTGGPP